MIRSVAVIGLGLLGGSICKKIKQLSPGTVISAYGRNQEVLNAAKNDGVIDSHGAVTDMRPAGVELIIVATPVTTSIGIIKDVLDNVTAADDTLVIDVGSVKQGICDAVADHPQGYRFVGCHPMAGSERSGYHYSDGSILENASVIVTPMGVNSTADTGRITQFWEWLGGNVLTVDAETHDRMVAMTSHLPHVLSSSLMELIGDNDEDNTAAYLPFSGKGLRDMTRLAGGSPDLWSEIVSLNRKHVLGALDQYMAFLTQVRDLLTDDAEGKAAWNHFQKAREYRKIMEDA